MNTSGDVQNFVGVYPSHHDDEQIKGPLNHSACLRVIQS